MCLHAFRSKISDNDIINTQIIKKHSELNKETHVAFIDFEDAFDRVDRNVLWKVLEGRGYLQLTRT